MNILMISESGFPLDVRVRQETLTLAAAGHCISVVAIGETGEPFHERWKGIEIYRIRKVELFRLGKQVRTEEKKGWGRTLTVMIKAVLGYGFEHCYFTTAGFLLSLWICWRNRIDAVHTHNPPDTLFFIANFLKLFGKKFVYDHHDLAADLLLTKYGSKTRPIYRLLLLLEKISCRTADRIIATNRSYRQIEHERCGAAENKIFVVRNGPDLKILKPVKPDDAIRNRAKTILCYLGAINVQDGVDHLLKILDRLVHHLGVKDTCLLVIGDGDFLYRVRELTGQLNLEDQVIFTGYVNDRQRINQLLSSADIFVDAAPKTFLNDHSTFIKHAEYLVFGKPVISFALKESMATLQKAGVFVEPGNIDQFAHTIVHLIQDQEKRDQMGKFARERVRFLSWEQTSKPLVELYRHLLPNRR